MSFLLATSFWNLVGAGLPIRQHPLALFYTAGMNLISRTASTALFGVYGMLGIGRCCSACAA